MRPKKMEIEKIMDATTRTFHIAFGTALFLGCLTLSGVAQDQAAKNQQTSPDQSPQDNSAGSALGDYARQVRKDNGGKTKTKVFDNDNLPREDKLSVVGPPSPENTNTSSDTNSSESAGETKAEVKTEAKAASQPPAETKATTKTPEDEEKQRQAAWKQWLERIGAQKDQIDLLQREFDVLQREYQIRAAAFYADAGNRLRNQGGWDKQDADYKQQIADKQKALEDGKQKLEDVQEEARKAGVPASIREP